MSRVSVRYIIDDVPAAMRFYTMLLGFTFRTNDIVTGPGGDQVILDGPSGNPVELFQPRR